MLKNIDFVITKKSVEKVCFFDKRWQFIHFGVSAILHISNKKHNFGTVLNDFYILNISLSIDTKFVKKYWFFHSKKWVSKSVHFLLKMINFNHWNITVLCRFNRSFNINKFLKSYFLIFKKNLPLQITIFCEKMHLFVEQFLIQKINKFLV